MRAGAYVGQSRARSTPGPADLLTAGREPRSRQRSRARALDQLDSVNFPRFGVAVGADRQVFDQGAGRQRRLHALGNRWPRRALLRRPHVPDRRQGGRPARGRAAADLRPVPVGRLPAAVGLSDRRAVRRAAGVRSARLHVSHPGPAAARGPVCRRVVRSGDDEESGGDHERDRSLQVGRGVHRC